MLGRKIYQETVIKFHEVAGSCDCEEYCVREFKRIYADQFEVIKKAHQAGGGGIEVAKARASLMDALLQGLFSYVLRSYPRLHEEVALVALGGYGRGYLNPYSDVDLLFLTRVPSKKIPEEVKLSIERILYPLWDFGFKVGHSARDWKECIVEAKQDTRTFTSLLESRLLSRKSTVLFEPFLKAFRSQVVRKGKRKYLLSRMEDLRYRHAKYSNTVFLQEPNVKESPGGLRDFQNIFWAANVTNDCFELIDLEEKGLLSERALGELTEAVDFMHRVRNELHYQAKRSSDILTLHLQGVVASAFRYPERTILRRTESFMRDYYRHARALEDRLQSVLEILDLRAKAEEIVPSLIPMKKKRQEVVDGFLIQKNGVKASKEDIFEEDPSRLMKVFQICQVRGLSPDPDLRRLIKNNEGLITSEFLHDTEIAEIFQSILERKGDVARILRLMHRVGFLGKWLPEFGALDCLVQHEFFHRYTADEHTLRCIEQLDALFTDKVQSVNKDLFRQLLVNVIDPYALYLAMLLHDSGRSEDVREHSDGSLFLATHVCTRLRIVGSRRRTILFLIDNHLIFWLYATTRNIDDIEVIAEFANIVKSQEYLELLYLFTYADSMGTNEEAWNSWKEGLMKQLYRNTSLYFQDGNTAKFQAHLDEEAMRVREKALHELSGGDMDEETIRRHFELLPKRYYRFRKMSSIIAHIQTMEHFIQNRDRIAPATRWRAYEGKGYTELVVSAEDQPQLLEKLCCALASQQINILSAEIFTRRDGVVLDILRICTTRHEPVTDSRVQQRVENTFIQLLKEGSDYSPEKYLQKKVNFLTKTQEGLPFPVRAEVRNDVHPVFTVVEIQARDRIGLLHDIFHCISELNLMTITSRISTEKGAALDAIYILTADKEKVRDKEVIALLKDKLGELIV